MNEEQLKEKALTYIGQEAICLYDKRQYLITSYDEIDKHGQVWMYAEAEDMAVKVYSSGKWAEIISQPKEETDHEGQPIKYFGGLEEKNIPEPKAGDMVYGSNEGDSFSDTIYRNTGGKLSDGRFIVEHIGKNYIAADFFKYIRLPQKSEVESKVDEFKERFVSGNEIPRNIVKEAIKWGQQNPTKK